MPARHTAPVPTADGAGGGFGELTELFTCREPFSLELRAERPQGRAIVKIKLIKHGRNNKFGFDPFGRRRIYTIPLFHHSIIPCVKQDYKDPVTIYSFNKF
jgi:hypothetical protein